MENRDPAEVSVLLERARQYWAERGSPMTQVRRVICQTVFGCKSALDAEQLLREARKVDRLISLSTVYRTLNALVEAGLLVEVEGRDGRKSYDVAGDSANASSHVVCSDCGTVIPVENPCLSLRESAFARKQGFSPRKLSLRYEANCDQLHQTGHCERADTKPGEA